MLPPITEIEHQVGRALEEDVGSGDVTAQLIPVEQTATARVISRCESAAS